MRAGEIGIRIYSKSSGAKEIRAPHGRRPVVLPRPVSDAAPRGIISITAGRCRLSDRFNGDSSEGRADMMREIEAAKQREVRRLRS